MWNIPTSLNAIKWNHRLLLRCGVYLNTLINTSLIFLVIVTAGDNKLKKFNFWKSGLKTGRKLRPKSTLNYIFKTKANVCYDFDPMKGMLVDFSFDNLNSNRSTEWTWAIFSSLRFLIYEVMIGYAWMSLMKNKSGKNKIPLPFICEGDESTENM